VIKAESALHRFLNCGDLVRFRAHNGSHHRRLGEEAVSAYIEEESFVRHRSGEAAKNFVCLKDKWGIPLTSKLEAALRPAGPPPRMMARVTGLGFILRRGRNPNCDQSRCTGSGRKPEQFLYRIPFTCNQSGRINAVSKRIFRLY